MRDDATAGHDLRRRAVVKGVLAVPVAGFVGWPAGEASATLLATPACADDEPTPPQTAGPFYTPGSPERVSLVDPGLPGSPLSITGQVLTTACLPVARALLDFWHADDAGEYDLEGFRLRGHQFADAQGRFRLQTIRPGAYSGRTRHIHVRVQAPRGRVLTTQLYFPEEAKNRRDGLFSPRLVVDMASPGQGRFDFVLTA